MKTLKIIALGIVIFLSGPASAQVSVNVNVGGPPLWGPVGYNEIQYYYIPDVESYYDVPSGMFIYYEGGGWVRRSNLPKRYRGYDLYNGYKVVLVDYRGNSPYDNHNAYKNKYKKGYKGGMQKTNGPHPGKGNSNKNYSQKKSGNSQNVDHEIKSNNKQHAQPSHKQNKGKGGGKGKNH